MTLGQYLERLQILSNQYGPNTELIYSSDEEGNYFDYLCIGPEAVYYDNDEHEMHELDDNHQANAICVN